MQAEFGQGLEALEPRRLLSSDLPLVQFYPEGFASDRISEFVPLTNHGDEPVEYELWARYEVGQRDQLIAEGVVPPRTRGGVTITDARDPSKNTVRKGVPFALELRSSGELSATLSHYDFGTAVGEAFTRRTSDQWSFAHAERDARHVRDFVVFHNPNDEPVEVTLTAYGEDGTRYEITRPVEAHRRGGFNLHKERSLPDGPFGIMLHASRPIVAAISHYEIVSEQGFGAIGTPDGGALAGVVAAVEFEHHGDDDRGRGGDNRGRGGGDDNRGRGNDDRGGDNRGGRGGGDDNGNRGNGRGGRDDRIFGNAFLSILNANDENASVTLRFIDRDDNQIFHERTFTVPAGHRQTLNIRGMKFLDDEFGVLYTSDVPVTLSASVYRDVDATGIEAATDAATRWDFGEGFMATARRAGTRVVEEIYIFNPHPFEVDVTIQFTFTDGTTYNVRKGVDPLEIEDFKVHRDDFILAKAPAFYGVRILAPRPVVGMMEHWDDDLGGGFATPGTPGGLVVPLHQVLAI